MKVMVTIESHGSPPTLAEVIERYELAADEIDHEFGVVEVDPEARLYVVLVAPEAAARIRPNDQWQTEGPFSNPKIEPFGPDGWFDDDE